MLSCAHPQSSGGCGSAASRAGLCNARKGIPRTPQVAHCVSAQELLPCPSAGKRLRIIESADISSSAAVMPSIMLNIVIYDGMAFRA